MSAVALVVCSLPSTRVVAGSALLSPCRPPTQPCHFSVSCVGVVPPLYYSLRMSSRAPSPLDEPVAGPSWAVSGHRKGRRGQDDERELPGVPAKRLRLEEDDDSPNNRNSFPFLTREGVERALRKWDVRQNDPFRPIFNQVGNCTGFLTNNLHFLFVFVLTDYPVVEEFGLRVRGGEGCAVLGA